jgi:hypothetical protein
LVSRCYTERIAFLTAPPHPYICQTMRTTMETYDLRFSRLDYLFTKAASAEENLENNLISLPYTTSTCFMGFTLLSKTSELMVIFLYSCFRVRNTIERRARYTGNTLILTCKIRANIRTFHSICVLEISEKYGLLCCSPQNARNQ